MKAQIFLFLLICLSSTSPYKHITNYKEYQSLWAKQVPAEYVHDVTHIATHDEKCGYEKCKFYYYEHREQEESEDTATILLVSGLHGNQPLGPHVLLYGYQHFRGAHIIYFPLANPSGFERNQSETYPAKSDPSKDFPVDGNKDCYQTNAALILDFLFRRYRFTMTLILRDDQDSSISFGWGSFTDEKATTTTDYPIQMDIAKVMRRAAGSNATLKMNQYTIKLGNTEGKVSGSFENWLYAISKDPKAITECNSFKYKPYAVDMGSQMVFSIGMGPKDTQLLGSEIGLFRPEGKDSDTDGFVSRGIRLIRQTLTVFAPSIELKWNQTAVEAIVKGCKKAHILTLDAVSYDEITPKVNKTILHIVQSTQVRGTLKELPQKPTTITLKEPLQFVAGEYLDYVVEFSCENEWEGLEETSLAKKRVSLASQTFLTKQKKSMLQRWMTHIYLVWIKYWRHIVVFLIIIFLLHAAITRFLQFWQKRRFSVHVSSSHEDEHFQQHEMSHTDLPRDQDRRI